MIKGNVKEFFPGEKYGFIITEDDDEYFFHSNDIHVKSRNKKIYSGQTVWFDVKADMKGDKAVNVRLE